MDPTRRPNILIIVTDHQLHYRHGWDDGERPLRPYFDALAEESIIFNRAYSVTPLCGPARRSLLTGLYPHTHKQYHNQTDQPFTKEVYSSVLSQHGYDNYYFGKWHAGPGSALDYDCRGFSPEFYGNPYITEEYAAYCARNDLPAAQHAIDYYFWNSSSRSTFTGLDTGVLDYTCHYSWCGEPCVGTTTTPKETHEGYFLADLACRQLEQLAVEPERPFSLRVDFWGPHQPYFPTPEFIDLYDRTGIKEYGSFRDTLENKPEVYRNMNQPIADERGKLIVPSIYGWDTWQEIMARVYAQSTMTDDAAGRILQTLKETGLYDDTLIIYTSDHGDGIGSHGGQFDKGSFMTEETIRVPLAVKLPGSAYGGSCSNALVQTIDLAPTILDGAGTGFSAPVQGTSLLPLCRQEQRGRETMLLESYGQGYRDRKKSRTLITGDYKYTVNEDDISELYHLAEDPYELHNLRDTQPLEDELRMCLREELQAYNDETGLMLLSESIQH